MLIEMDRFAYERVLKAIHRRGTGRMPKYRLYCLDGANKITRAQEIDAKGDDHAIEIVRSMKLPAKSELWCRERLVAQIPVRKR